MAQKLKKTQGNNIAMNRKALHDYAVLEKFEAGIVLKGWEVKSLRAAHAQIKESHIFVRQGEAFLLNAHISPILSVCTHEAVDPTRSRKLLLHRRQLNYLMGKVEQKGLTIVPLSMYWKNQMVKLEIALVQGKKLHDKREAAKQHDWAREKARLLKKSV